MILMKDKNKLTIRSVEPLGTFMAPPGLRTFVRLSVIKNVNKILSKRMSILLQIGISGIWSKGVKQSGSRGQVKGQGQGHRTPKFYLEA